jgi:hypothetical protein
MKKQIKDLTMEELLNNSTNEKVLALIGIGNIFKEEELETLDKVYTLMKKMVELFETSIDIEENV